MIHVDDEAPDDAGAREDLLDRVMGSGRWLKPSEGLRSGRLPAEGLALVARDGDRLVGSVRLWPVIAGGRDALLLGPLAVDCATQRAGIGSWLMRSALARAAALGHGAVILVGDPDYYARFGFSALPTERLVMPGQAEQHRFLGLELRPGTLDGARGLVTAAGVPAELPEFALEDFALAA